MKAENIDEIRDKGTRPDPLVEQAAIRQELEGVKSKLTEVGSALANTPNSDEIETLTTQVEAIKSSLENVGGDYRGLIDALTERVDELQTGAALLGGKAADQPEGIKAITQQIADSEAYKGLFDANGQKAIGNPINAWFGKTRVPSYTAGGYKAASPVTISDMAGGNQTAYRPGIFTDQYWAMNLATRIPSIVVRNATTYTIPRETDASRYGAWTSTLAADLDGDPTPKSTATFTDTDGLMFGSVVRFYDSNGDLLGSSTVISYVPATGVVTFTTDSLTWDAVTGDRVTSENYGVSAEEATKPSGWVGTENVSFNLKMLASLIPTTVNALNTIQGLEAMIESKLPERHLRNLSRHLLYGDDSAGQLQGLRSYSGAQTYSWSGGVTGDTQVDAVMRAANLIPWTSPIGIIMSQVDLPTLTLLKGSDGHYLRTGNFGMVPMSMVGTAWFLGPYELVFDYAVASTHFTVINWRDASEIADQDTASLMWGYINADFEQNIIRARYEATLCHAIKSTQAYVVGTWDSAP